MKIHFKLRKEDNIQTIALCLKLEAPITHKTHDNTIKTARTNTISLEIKHYQSKYKSVA